MKLRIAFVLALLATPVIAGTALGHTGSIRATQSCEDGNTAYARLDGNVAASASWTVRIRGTVVDSGSGPGPRDLGPYPAGRDSGFATLTIVFHQETNVYSAKLKETPECPTPTPEPTPTPTPSPTPIPTPSATPTPTPTPTATPTGTPTSTPTAVPTPTFPPTTPPTLPPTDATSTISSGIAETSLVLVGVLAFLMVLIGTLGMWSRRLRDR